MSQGRWALATIKMVATRLGLSRKLRLSSFKWRGWFLAWNFICPRKQAQPCWDTTFGSLPPVPRLLKSLKGCRWLFPLRLNRRSGSVVTAPSALFPPEPQAPPTHPVPDALFPNLLPLPPAPGKTRLHHSHCGFRSRERSRETPGFSATETGKQSLRKRCQGPEGHIFPSKHCKVSRGFTWRSCLGMCLLFLEQQAPYLRRYTHIWCECYHGKCHAFFSVEKKGK